MLTTIRLGEFVEYTIHCFRQYNEGDYSAKELFCRINSYYIRWVDQRPLMLPESF